MPKRLVVGFAGEPGSGKTLATTHLWERLGIPRDCPGDRLRAEAGRLGIKLGSRADSMALVRDMEQAKGSEVLMAPVLASTQSIMSVDGIRRLSDIEQLRAAPDLDFYLIAIYAPAGERHRRIQQAALERKHRDSADFDTFLEETWAESWNDNPREPSTQAVMQAADYGITNFGDRPTFLAAVRTTLQQICAQSP